MKYYLKNLLVCLFLLLVSGCGSEDKNVDLDKLQTVTATLQPSSITLYYSGVVTPLNVITVASPVDGTITQKLFDYGTEIDKDQLLLVIRSSQLAEEYQTSLTTYLKSKKDYLNNLTQMRGIDYLKKLGIISENEYITSKSTNYDLELSYNQAARKLQQTLEKMGNDVGDIMQLKIEETEEVHKALAQPADILKITAPTSGIILMPSKGSGSDDSGGILNVGSQVKSGQVLLGIGDSSGISLVIKVNEININSIKVGQAATISSDAFAPFVLRGRVEQIVQQATPSESGGAPTFPISIVVPRLTDQERKVIHMGMSAKVAIDIQSRAAIRVPISAVIIDNGVPIVKVLDPEAKKILTVPVVTGPTTMDMVQIEQGLKPGDKVIINASD